MLAEKVVEKLAGTLFPTQDDSLCTAVVAGCQGSESLLSRSVLEKKQQPQKNQHRLKRSTKIDQAREGYHSLSLRGQPCVH